MKIQFGLALAPFILFANVSCAQNSILAGKILDENKNPVPGAVVTVAGKSHKLSKEATTDINGLYNISPLPDGKYNVSIVAKNGTYDVKKLELRGVGDYHNFVVGGKRVEVIRTKEDPFLKPKLNALRERQKKVDMPVGAHRIHFAREDSNGKLREVNYGENVPQSK